MSSQASGASGIPSKELELIPFPSSMTLRNRLRVVAALQKGIQPVLEAALQQRDTRAPGFDMWEEGVPWKMFGHIGISKQVSPIIAIVDYDGRVLVGPRLVLGLQEDAPRKDSLEQLPKIADHIARHDLAERYPYITTTTYVELSRVVGRLLGFRPALITYFPPDTNGENGYLQNIGLAHAYFCERNNIPEHTCQPDSLAMPTVEFVQRWASN